MAGLFRKTARTKGIVAFFFGRHAPIMDDGSTKRTTISPMQIKIEAPASSSANLSDPEGSSAGVCCGCFSTSSDSDGGGLAHSSVQSLRKRSLRERRLALQSRLLRPPWNLQVTSLDGSHQGRKNIYVLWPSRVGGQI